MICGLAAPELAEAKSDRHELVKIYLDSGTGGQTPAMGVKLVSTVAAGGPDVVSCTPALSAMDVICGASGYSFEIAVGVDGNLVDAGQSATNAGNCGGSNWADNYAVAPGHHKIRPYTKWGGASSASQGPRSIHYEVTVP